jgi:hypothetical protein
MKRLFLISLLIMYALLPVSCGGPESEETLAQRILNDRTLDQVDSMARVLLTEGFNAGSGYSQVWARDLNTFIETSCEVVDPADVRGALLLFFAFQQENGEILDGYVLREEFYWDDDQPFYSPLAPNHTGFKNTVETDQETSLIQAICKYIDKTGDIGILDEVIGGLSVRERIGLSLEYLRRERLSEEYGLIFGATTADWGDVQPLTDNVVDINEATRFAIDVYDNAMLMIALQMYADVTGDPDGTLLAWRETLKSNVRKHLWDKEKGQFIAHLYLDDSPIPANFDESTVYYHGGTAVAIEAGLLTPEEVKASLEKMRENVRASGMPSIGLTLYPPYPEGFFHGGMSQAYNYQNGGDWTWFGGRMIQQLIRFGMADDAYREIRPMIDRVLKNDGFFEWYGPGNVPSGSGRFKGSAGVLAKAIALLREWSWNTLIGISPETKVISCLEIYDVASRSHKVIAAFPFLIEAPNWTPDGKWLVINKEGRLYKIAPDGSGGLLPIDTGDVTQCNNDHVITADGRWIGLSSNDPANKEGYNSYVFLVPFEGGQPRRITPLGPSYLHGISPDGKWAAYCAFRGPDWQHMEQDVWVIPTEGGEEIRLTDAPGLDDGPEYSPDGKHIWFNSVRTGRMQVWKMDTDGSNQTQMTFDPHMNAWFPHVSPDGKKVVYIAYHDYELAPGEHLANKHVQLRMIPSEGGTPDLLLSFFGGQGSLNVNSWNPESTQFAYVSYRLKEQK